MAAARCSAPASALPGPRVLIREGTGGGGAGPATRGGRGRKGEGRGWRRAAWEAAPGANFQKRARWRHGTRRKSRHAARALPRSRPVARGLCGRREVRVPAGCGFLGGGPRLWAVQDLESALPRCLALVSHPAQVKWVEGVWRKPRGAKRRG
uniref:Uncharacterized protein n=1 Tax=Rousettus aegyptiacus TaxID=9407 RepID=A0A7J8CHR3_ROUAE|nr:hypothetical protein HJG63_008999 [Rousettus aegyptiacus]